MTSRQETLIAAGILALVILVLALSTWAVPRLTLDPWTGHPNATAASGICAGLGALLGALSGPVVAELWGRMRRCR